MMDINKLPNQLDEEEFENLIKKVREKTEAEIVSIEEKIKILTEYPI